MADEDLRALERDLQAGASPAARVRYASALERSHAPASEILAVLLPGREDESVREWIGRIFPAWESPEFSSHQAHYIDVPPLRTRPKVRWVQRLGSEQGLRRFMLLASPLGIVCTAKETETVQVLHPDTGELRWEFSWPTTYRPRGDDPVGYLRRWPEIVGSTLCLWDCPRLVCRDLWTGEELHSTDLGNDIVQIRVCDGRLFGWGDDRVAAFAFPEPREPPRTKLWVCASPFTCGFGQAPGSLLTHRGDLLVRAYGEPRTLVLDQRTGQPRGDIERAFRHSDDSGLTGPANGAHGIYADPLSPPLWTSRGFALAASPQIVVASPQEPVPGERERLRVVVHDRNTGERLGLIVDGVVDYGAIAIARDVIYQYVWRLPLAFFGGESAPGPMAESTLSAHDSTGREIWNLPYEVLGSAIMGLAPLHDQRLYGLTQDGAVFCLEPDSQGGL